MQERVWKRVTGATCILALVAMGAAVISPDARGVPSEAAAPVVEEQGGMGDGAAAAFLYSLF